MDIVWSENKLKKREVETFLNDAYSVMIIYIYRGVANGGSGGHGSPTSVSELNKVQQFPFQASGILFFLCAQKL